MTRAAGMIAPRSPEWRERFRGQFAKTRLCRFSSEGECRYGDRCTFAHSTTELETPPDLVKTSLCIAWEKGCCRVASQFCPFAHGEAELRATAAFVEQPLSTKLKRFAADSNKPVPLSLQAHVVEAGIPATMGQVIAPPLGTCYSGHYDRNQRYHQPQQLLQHQVAPGADLVQGWMPSGGSGNGSTITDDTSSSPGDGSGGSDDTKAKGRCRRGRRSIEGMLKRKERHERHRLMVSAQKQWAVDPAEHTNLPLATLVDSLTEPQPAIQMVMPGDDATILSSLHTHVAAGTMSFPTRRPPMETNYMQPQTQPPIWQMSMDPGAGCFKAWEVEGILRSAMPLHYED